ncbi:MAG: hypothetical protein K0U15_06725 [Proteobacteria bacterium]|nr:hypothetical protein [Pseudomonadota bacterium]
MEPWVIFLLGVVGVALWVFFDIFWMYFFWKGEEEETKEKTNDSGNKQINTEADRTEKSR